MKAIEYFVMRKLMLQKKRKPRVSKRTRRVVAGVIIKNYGRGLIPAPSAKAKKLMAECARRLPEKNTKNIWVREIFRWARGRKPDMVWDDYPIGVAHIGRAASVKGFSEKGNFTCVAVLTLKDPATSHSFHSIYFMAKPKK